MSSTTYQVDNLGVKGPLSFNKNSFSLAWTSHQSAIYYVQEYLPKGKTDTHFSQMLSIFMLEGNTNPADAAMQKTNELAARKKTDPTCNYMIHKNKDGKEVMLDFLLGEKDVQEFNVYRYAQIDMGNNRKALLLYAYSKRAYRDKIPAFLQDLKTQRPGFLNEMGATQMPTIHTS